MFIKSVIIFAIIVLFIDGLNARSTVRRTDTDKKVKCRNLFTPDRPKDMSDEDYEKYKISSKGLSEQDKKDFWNKFIGWWKNVFAAIGKFFEKVGKFFENLFSKKKSNQETTTPMTEAPPTPSPEKLKKRKNILICEEYEDNTNGTDYAVTTKTYEVDVSSAQNKDIEKLVTTIQTTEALITTVGTERVTEITTEEAVITTTRPESTPSDPNSDNKEKTDAPVIAGVENKAKEDENTDATVVRAV